MTDKTAGSARAKPDWATQIADRVVRRYERDGAGDRGVVIASGVSPSGPIHLGNLRELLVPHFVAEEIRARGIACEHLLSWDDYDRLRKVPAGVDETFAEHIGRPLSAIPDPDGEASSWAERFKQPLRVAMAELGVELREISQTEMYGSGTYLSQILHSLDQRKAINDVLARYRTLEVEQADDDGEQVETGAEDDGSVDIGDDYWPYKVYCQGCGRDLTDITSVEQVDGTEGGLPAECWISYRCSACDHEGRFDLVAENHGKLVWKVDWPMRWAFEGVTFEAGGADHSSPGSSFSVGSELVTEIFGSKAPEYEAYSFVGMRGMGKMSSSAGAVPTPADALQVLEPQILRWIYVRKTPRQNISIDLAGGIHGLYDEWDSQGRKAAAGEATPSQLVTRQRAAHTRLAGDFAPPAEIVPFRTLASAVQVAAGDAEQTARIIGELTDVPAERAADTEPRLAKARHWVDHFAPPEERIVVRDEPDRVRLEGLSELEATWIGSLLDQLDDDWSLEGARALAYGVPKLAAGLPLDTPPTDELKAAQRAFFKLLYELLLSADTGPRIPTLLMALGQSRVRHLLGAPD